MDHGRSIVALLLLSAAAAADAFAGPAAPHALQQRRGLHASNSCGGRGVQVHCMKKPRAVLAHRGGIGVVAPRLPEHELEIDQLVYPGWRAEALERSFALDARNREIVSEVGVGDAFKSLYPEPTEDLAKVVVVGVSLAVGLAAVLNLPVTTHVSAHAMSGAVSAITAVVLLGNPFFGGDFGHRMNKSYQNLVPLLSAAFNKAVVCGTYAAAYGAITSMVPASAVTVSMVSVATVATSALVTGLAATMTELTVDGNLAKAHQLKLAYSLARVKGMSRLMAVQHLWAQRPMRDSWCAKAFWSATKLNIWGFEVFYLSWHALASASPWIGQTIVGNLVGGAVAGAIYAASMALADIIRDASRDGLAASSLACQLRAWVWAVRARASEMTLQSFAAGVRFASYKVVYDTLARV